MNPKVKGQATTTITIMFVCGWLNGAAAAAATTTDVVVVVGNLVHREDGRYGLVCLALTFNCLAFIVILA